MAGGSRSKAKSNSILPLDRPEGDSAQFSETGAIGRKKQRRTPLLQAIRFDLPAS